MQVNMKPNRILITAFILLVFTGALYRLVPDRPLGFAPQFAMAIFGGALIKDRKWAIALPVFSMFLSDALFELLTRAGVVSMPGFYEGQWINYLLIAGVTFIGMAIRKVNVRQIALASVAAPVAYFLLSNGALWLGGGGYARPKTAAGLMQCYADALPFFKGSLAATLCFSALLFGAYLLVQRSAGRKIEQALV
jgi:hypothetical protein